MNYFNLLFTIGILLIMVNGVISVYGNRFNGPDPDSQNRLSRTNPMSFVPMRDGGGWPSTTGEPSGGGRWNLDLVRMKCDDNHADQMNPNNDEYWHSRD
jgi:hypothetical protein